MKTKILKYTFAAFLAVSLGSCANLVDDIYDNPNNPTDAPAEYILPATALSNALFQEGEAARLAGLWCGYFTGADRQYITLDGYITNAGDYDSPWGTVYQGAYSQADIIREKAEAEGNEKLAAVAKIHMAWAIGATTALWGDVPFSQANSAKEFPNPAYDSQQEVYAGAQKLLDDAIVGLDGKGGLIDKTKDIFFTGNFAKWKDVAYTLKARYYMHTKEYAKAYEAASKGVKEGSDLMLAHGEAFGMFNTYYEFLDVQRPGYMSAYEADLPKLMEARANDKTSEEARLGYYFTKDGYFPGEYDPNFYYNAGYGVPNGIFGADEPFRFVSYHENLLILAESGARTAGTSKGLEHLNEFRDYMSRGGYVNPEIGTPKMDPYVSGDFASGGIENKDGISAEKALLREILEERYVTMYGTFEGFNDLRRTWNETDVRVSVTIKNGGAAVPQRFLYPQSEINSNSSTPSLPDLFDPTPVNK